MNSLPAPVVHPARGDLPVLLSVPHSGRDYPDWLVALSAKGESALSALEDPLVDRLVWRALGRGIGAVIARAPRAAIDCNRGEDEIDPAIVSAHGRSRMSPRARGGLGIVPSRTAVHGHLWRRRITRGELDQRLEDAYRPYHRAIAEQLGIIVERFGCALLLDCHSMPPADGAKPIVFGDRYGRSAAPWLTAEALAIAANIGFSASANDPFAGGYILDRHGFPQNGIHALQVEVDRRLYLVPGGEAGGRFNDVAELIDALANRLGRLILDRRLAAAAE